MSEQLHALEQEFRRIEVDLYNASVEFKTFVMDAAHKRAAYDVAYAQAMLDVSHRADKDGIKMTVGEKDALVIVAVKGLLTDCRIAEALRDGSKAHLQTLQSLLSGAQTRASLIKTEERVTACHV